MSEKNCKTCGGFGHGVCQDSQAHKCHPINGYVLWRHIEPKEEAPKGTGWYVVGWWCEDSQLWIRVYLSEPKPIKKLVEHWIEGNHNNYDPPLKVCQYMTDPHSLQPVEEEKEESTPGPWGVMQHGEKFCINDELNENTIAETYNKADAQLIADAPQTLKERDQALKDLEEAVGILHRTLSYIGPENPLRDRANKLLTKLKAND